MTAPGFVAAGILGQDREGNRVLAEADIEVSAEENRITLSGEIPGITGNHRSASRRMISLKARSR